MVCDPPGKGRDLNADGPRFAGRPLLVTAELPDDVFAWADAIRRTHYPPDRNRLGAHVTLFHALPPSAEPEVRRLIAEQARSRAPEARITGLMDLGPGTAYAVESAGMSALHAELAGRLHGIVQQKDARPLKLHITVQNKVPSHEAAKLRSALSRDFVPRRFRFMGLGLYHWNGESWVRDRAYPFRGRE